MNKGYKNYRNTTSEKTRQKRIELTKEYLESHKVVNEDTGEIRCFYPDNTKDIRKKAAAKKSANPNSYASRVYAQIKDEAYFYTINLADVRKEWQDYSVIFNKKKADGIKAWLKKTISGPFCAKFEVAGFTGTHLHVVCRKQSNDLLRKVLKAEAKVSNEAGLIEYFQKPVISPKDRGKEVYDEMVGANLQEKAKAKKQGKRCARNSFYRMR